MTISFTSVAVIAVVAVLARLGGGRRTGGRSEHARSRLPLAPCRSRNRLRAVPRPGAQADGPRLRGVVGIALLVGLALRGAGFVRSPLLIAIILSATGLGVILPILKDAGPTATPFGQVVVAGASIAEVGPIVLLSLFFSGESGGLGAKLALLLAAGLLSVIVFPLVSLTLLRGRADALSLAGAPRSASTT